MKKYIWLSVIVFIIGILIFLTEGFSIPFIRFYLGDVFAIWFIYLLISIFTKLRIWQKSLLVFLIAIIIEILQLFTSSNGSVLKEIFLGSTFDIYDIIIYAISILIIALVDYKFIRVEKI